MAHASPWGFLFDSAMLAFVCTWSLLQLGWGFICRYKMCAIQLYAKLRWPVLMKTLPSTAPEYLALVLFLRSFLWVSIRLFCFEISVGSKTIAASFV